MPTKRVPLTLNFDQSKVVGYAEVNTETGEITGHITSETETGSELVKLMSRELVRACSLSFELDGRQLREEELKAITRKFTPKRRNWMTDLSLPKPKSINYEHDLEQNNAGCS